MTATNDELLAELQAIRETVEASNRVLAGKASRRSVFAIGFSVILSLAVGIGGLAYAVDQRHDQCVAGNVGRANTRNMVSDAMLASSEALIAVARDADPEEVENFRSETERRADEITSRLPDREC